MTLFVFYSFDSMSLNENNLVYDCFEIKDIDPKNEVFLLDILKRFPIKPNFCFNSVIFPKTIEQNNSIDLVNYPRSYKDSIMINLDSPFSIVPTFFITPGPGIGNDSAITHLMLSESSFPPWIPEDQSLLFYDKSIKSLYAKDYYDKIHEKGHALFINKTAHDVKINYSEYYPEETNFYKAASPKPDKSNASESLGFNSLNEAAERAKEAAKSIFSFASMVGKTVYDATQQMNLSQGPMSPGSIVQVGKQRFEVKRLVAEGGFGLVFQVVLNNNPSQVFALKQIICQSKDQVNEAQTEVDTLKKLSHSNIIRLVDYSISTEKSGNSSHKKYIMLFPFYPNGTVWDQIEKANIQSTGSSSWPLNETKALYFTLSIARALEYLHKSGLVHRDVKPHNMLIGNTNNHFEVENGLNEAILTDFGSVAPSSIKIKNKSMALQLEDEASIKTSAAYRAPELTSPPLTFPYEIDDKVDTWGLGCSLYCMAFGRSPFESPRDGVMKLAILNGKYSYPPNFTKSNTTFSNHFISLIDQMLSVDAIKRPSMSQLIIILENLINLKL